MSEFDVDVKKLLRVNLTLAVALVVVAVALLFLFMGEAGAFAGIYGDRLRILPGGPLCRPGTAFTVSR